MLGDPVEGPRATVEKLKTPGLYCYQSLFCLLYLKMLNLTFTSRELTFFAIRRLHFTSPRPTNKVLKKTSLDLSFFLGFNFDGRPIKFKIHSRRCVIVEIYA